MNEHTESVSPSTSTALLAGTAGHVRQSIGPAAAATSERYEYVYRTAKALITDYLRLREDELQPETHMVDDLGADSLALIELGFRIAETFGVPMMDTSGGILVFKVLVEHILNHMPESQA